MARIYPNIRILKKWWSFIPAFIWISLVVVLSVLPERSFKQYRWWHFDHADKVVHLGFYFVMAFLILYGFKKITELRGTHYTQAIVFCIVISILIEVVQQTELVSRHFEILDIIANIIGALLGSVLFLKFNKLLPHGSRN